VDWADERTVKAVQILRKREFRDCPFVSSFATFYDAHRALEGLVPESQLDDIPF
jgi:hypothetical protein